MATEIALVLSFKIGRGVHRDLFPIRPADKGAVV